MQRGIISANVKQTTASFTSVRPLVEKLLSLEQHCQYLVESDKSLAKQELTLMRDCNAGLNKAELGTLKQDTRRASVNLLNLQHKG